MNYSLYWLVVEAYKKEFIGRDEFIRQWKNVQALEAMQNEKNIKGFLYVIDLYKRELIDRKEFIKQWGAVQNLCDGRVILIKKRTIKRAMVEMA